MAEFYGQAMSDVPFYVVHTIKDESARITRAGALDASLPLLFGMVHYARETHARRGGATQ